MIYENIDIRKKVEEVTNMMEIRIKMRNIKLITEIDENVPKIFCTEPRRLKQILINLIGNAIKFTFKGFIKIKIKKVMDKRNLLNISVEDTGLGIKKENIPKLFKMFSMLMDSKE